MPRNLLVSRQKNKYIKYKRSNYNGQLNIVFGVRCAISPYSSILGGGEIMTLILGKSQATAQQMAAYLLSKNPKPKFSRNITALEFCQIFLDECAKEGVRGDGAFAQSCKETGNFTYGGDVKYAQNNFAGIGATGGVPGCSFSSIEVGVLAQAQHLKTYATNESLNCENVDPRRTTWFVNTKGGTADTFEKLGGSWACPGYDTKKYKSLEDANKAKDSYGYQIVDILDDILKIKTKEETNMVYKVAIDAGHGSKTAGKRTPDNYLEHWINVKSAYYCEQYLQKHGVTTFRVGWDDTNATDDSDVALSTRQKQIKNAGCHYSISFHANAHQSVWNSASGVETLIHSNSAYVGDSLAMATKIQARLVQGTKQKNRGVKKQSLAMCNCVAMNVRAACLVEIGFMTNKEEATLMKTEMFCKEQGEDAAKGFLDYIGIKVDNSVSTPATSSPTVTVSSNTYVVQRGDTLSKIGQKTGVAWKTIADLNGIKFPYVVKVGQVLKLSKSNSTNTTTAKPTTTTTTTTTSKGYVYNGVNYSLVFNPTYYASYSDLKRHYGDDSIKLFEHFCKYGMSEGRIGSANFNVNTYKKRYADLRKAFGDDLPAYYKHYVEHGYKEGRSGK